MVLTADAACLTVTDVCRLSFCVGTAGIACLAVTGRSDRELDWLGLTTCGTRRRELIMRCEVRALPCTAGLTVVGLLGQAEACVSECPNLKAELGAQLDRHT